MESQSVPYKFEILKPSKDSEDSYDRQGRLEGFNLAELETRIKGVLNRALTANTYCKDLSVDMLTSAITEGCYEVCCRQFLYFSRKYAEVIAQTEDNNQYLRNKLNRNKMELESAEQEIMTLRKDLGELQLRADSENAEEAAKNQTDEIEALRNALIQKENEITALKTEKELVRLAVVKSKIPEDSPFKKEEIRSDFSLDLRNRTQKLVFKDGALSMISTQNRFTEHTERGVSDKQQVIDTTQRTFDLPKKIMLEYKPARQARGGGIFSENTSRRDIQIIEVSTTRRMQHKPPSPGPVLNETGVSRVAVSGGEEIQLKSNQTSSRNTVPVKQISREASVSQTAIKNTQKSLKSTENALKSTKNEAVALPTIKPAQKPAKVGKPARVLARVKDTGGTKGKK